MGAICERTHLQGHGGAGAALGVLGELDADRLAVGEARVLVRVDAHEVVGLGGEHNLPGPGAHVKKTIWELGGGGKGEKRLARRVVLYVYIG